MDWQPISKNELLSLVADQLSDCTDGLREFFARVRVPAAKWQQSPWGDLGGGFWVLATHDDRVLWYNDIEDGFNVSWFTEAGRIPDAEYWCNQDTLGWALPRLQSGGGLRLGPPQPIP